MRRALLAMAVVLSAAAPVIAQNAPSPATTEPIPIPENAPPGSSMPPETGIGSGIAAVLVVGIGLILLSSMAFMGPA